MSEYETITPQANGAANGNGIPAGTAPGGSASPAGYLGQAPPSVGVLQAARRYPLLVIAPALLLLAVGVAIAMQRTPVYTADARLTVGRINLNAPGALAGYASATQALASQFARSATAQPVVEQISDELDIPEDRVRRRISASPIPESPIFTVRATARNPEGAIALANATSESVVRYAREFNDRDPDSSALLAEYKETSNTLAQRQARLDELRSRFGDDVTGAERRSLARARASRDFWSLREQAVEARYLAATGGEASSRLIEVLNPAEKAASDRLRYVQILGFAGLVTGLLLGFGLATLWANRVLRRRLAASP